MGPGYPRDVNLIMDQWHGTFLPAIFIVCVFSALVRLTRVAYPSAIFNGEGLTCAFV